MVKHALRLGMALALSTGLGGIALAQQNGAPGSTTTPTQMQQPGQMQQPMTGMPAPTAPGKGPAATNPGYPQAAAPGSMAPYRHEAKLSPATVKQAQQQLRSEGLYHGAIDGRIGPATRAAVRRFQQQNRLTTNAMLDRETLQRLMGNHHG
jgi:hypothetical protein